MARQTNILTWDLKTLEPFLLITILASKMLYSIYLFPYLSSAIEYELKGGSCLIYTHIFPTYQKESVSINVC